MVSRVAAVNASLMCRSATNTTLGRPDAPRQKIVSSEWPSPTRRGQLRNRCGAEPVREAHEKHAGYWRCTERGLWAMQAEQRGSMDRAYRKAVAVKGGAPISPS